MSLLERILPAKTPDELFALTNIDDARRGKAWLADRIAYAKRLPPGDLHSEVVTITPAMAEIILANHNIGNRPLKTARFKYAKSMEDGLWKLTSQGISFSRDGILNNGQNRLSAIIIAARPVKMMVSFGEDRSVFDILDTGDKRTGADTFAIKGKENCAALAAAVRVLWNIERGSPLGNASIGNDVLLDVLAKHPDIERHCTAGSTIGKKLRASTGGLTAAFYLIGKRSSHARRLPEFTGRLLSGVGVKPRDAVITLRDALMQRTLGRNGGVIAGATILAWNRFLTKAGTVAPSHIQVNGSKPFPQPE
jgi:hypothetical protein